MQCFCQVFEKKGKKEEKQNTPPDFFCGNHIFEYTLYINLKIDENPNFKRFVVNSKFKHDVSHS